ncbi:DUF4149 domain-containing protein [Campylobacter sp. VicNov18]|uniref:DUF4149 domain-containing protein n=1 Tax=Campylobacter bilis TaxID=2691918 RepID=UPI00130D6ACE|nr:DUF4149 domain-containing protein [Campylobacter bilis]MPV63501.1 DUF4149 domain-containing protein [Campylobacter hepaticus]MBM0637000.1 DUF4149 domain-containing protein [Campylobacter bilis]MCC8277712.1 DUF4149 domain-containing protein [Campylobacter bilis]MCC8299321.1 DUF4149 domain-containing protein [Campylobacter bilis]MCC8300621.1 DUF4149 domain-containing protein [Campylobacter bilis]
MKAINLFLLAAMIGIEAVLGIVVAPIVFYPHDLIGNGVLSHFQSGLIMTQIFVKMGYLIIGVSVVNCLFESYSFRKDKFSFKIKFSKLLLSILILILSLVFVFYFTHTIIELQSLGEKITQDRQFVSIHNASERVIKIILILQVVLYFFNFKKLEKDKELS